jgi:chaperonin GroES
MPAERFLENASELVSRDLAHEITIEKIRELNEKYQVYGAMVVVSRIDTKETGGIVKNISRSQEAYVVMTGPGEHTAQGVFVPVNFVEGQRVLATRYGGSDIELDGEKLLLLHVKQIYVGERVP